MNKLTTQLTQLTSIAEQATSGPWWTYEGKGVFSNGHEGLSLGRYYDEDHDSYLDCDRYDDDIEYIATFNPQVVQAMLKVIEAAKNAEQKFMNINDGFFTGLVPPAFAEISAALQQLSAVLGDHS